MIKDQVLEILTGQTDYISGQTLADSLGVSRNSVWKAVKALQQEGYAIESRTNLGYWLKGTTQRLNQAELIRTGGLKPGRIHVFDEIPSTNTYLKEHHGELPHQSVVLSGHQTAGRGRQGRSFHSPAGDGLYFSILYKDPIPDPRYVTLAAALAVSDGLEALGLSPAIKWVNDIYLDRRKVCGILTEGELELETGELKFLVLGIGLNVNNQTFPEELAPIATSLALITGRRQDLNEIAARLIQAVDRNMDRLMAKDPVELQTAIDGFIEAFNRRLYLKGSLVTLQGGNQQAVSGILEGVDELGHLILRTETGSRTFNYGEYRFRPGRSGDPSALTPSISSDPLTSSAHRSKE